MDFVAGTILTLAILALAAIVGGWVLLVCGIVDKYFEGSIVLSFLFSMLPIIIMMFLYASFLMGQV